LSLTQDGFGVGADLVVTSEIDRSEKLQRYGQTPQLSTSLEGASKIVPHCGQKGKVETIVWTSIILQLKTTVYLKGRQDLLVFPVGTLW
jgi:hypothetical protein